MTINSEKIYRLNKGDIPRAVTVLYDAFQHDPVFNAIFEGAAEVQRRALYETTLRYCFKYGQVLATSESMQGVAGWVWGRFATMSFWRMVASSAAWSSFKMGGEYAQRMGAVFKPIDQEREKLMGDQPYLFLFMIGVASDYQGQGFGRVLLDEVIRIAEQDRLPVYLETETENNVQLYQHFGFEVLDKVDLPIIHLPMWEMLRPPQ